MPAPSRPLIMYIMALAPGQTPAGWRRQMYSAVAHGVKFIRNYRLRDSLDDVDGGCYDDPEAHGSAPFAGMYLEARRTLWELGGFDDILVEGAPLARSKVALLMAETTDIWQPATVARQFAEASTHGTAGGYIQAASRWGTMGSERGALFLALQHAQLQLDVVTEQDLVDGHMGQYVSLFTAESHVSLAATAALRKWVGRGNTVFATATAGLRDEFNRTNDGMAKLLGVQHKRTELDSQGLNGTGRIVRLSRFACCPSR